MSIWFSNFVSTITPRFADHTRSKRPSWRATLALNRKLILWFLFLAILALVAGAVQDYHAYQTQWQLILDGKNPWLDFTEINNKNAYGPAFNALAIFYWIHPMLPKLLFIAAWAAASITLVHDISSFDFSGDISSVDISGDISENASSKSVRIREAVLYLFLSLFFLVEQIGFGHFDILVAAAILFGLRAYQQDRDVRAATFFSLAITLKFYPLVTLPFLALDQRSRIRWRFLLLTILFIAAIFAVAWCIWGNSVWDPFTFAAGREARQLSIFKFLSADDSVLRKLGLNIPLALWKPALLLVGGLTFLVHLKNRMSPSQACLTALMITFMIYPAGHHQFQAVLFFLAFMPVARDVRGESRFDPPGGTI